jgi:hypothetical protein
MSIGRISPPKELFEEIRKAYGIQTFVETGTYLGGTTFWASQLYRTVYTVEFAREIFESTSQKYASVRNINFLFGHSKDKLAQIVAELHEPAIFWLDAHWSGENTYGIGDECPLLEEIAIINSSPCEHFLFIDDARMFLSPPPAPCVYQQWPDITSIVLASRRQNRDPYIVAVADVLVAVPRAAKELVAAYCQRVNTQLWSEYGGSHLRKAMRHMGAYLQRK